MRVFVASVADSGRSYLASTVEVEGPRATLWQGGFEDVEGIISRIDIREVRTAVEPTPGRLLWRWRIFPPLSEWDDQPDPSMGMHVTRTIDFDFVVSGQIDCVLEEQRVALRAGDAIVLQAARHAWFNPGADPATLLICVYRPAVPAGDTALHRP